jgi:YD repeat-containing protein
LPGQDAAGLFPLSLLLDAAVSGETPWRPDWPVAMPPDGFALARGLAVGLTLVLPAGHTDAVPGGESGDSGGAPGGAEGEGGEAAVEYRLVRDMAGRFVEFPFFVNGVLCQAMADYGGGGPAEPRKIVLDNPAAPDPWEFEFLEYRQGAPILVRISHGGAWYFVAPEYLETRANETWYNAEGLAQGFFALEYRLQDGARRLVSTDNRSDEGEIVLAYDYNSAGRLSGISAPEGEYAALYNAAAQPRYWERPEGAYDLQWNEQGLLVRFTGVSWDKTSQDVSSQDETAAADERQIDIRYDYTLDERGNWIERRETSFDRRFGRLVPGSSVTIYRTINYGDN